MADPETPVPAEGSTNPAASAPGSAEGQADGSPPPGTTPTSDGNGQEPEQVLELRRRLTEMGEEAKNLKAAATILDRAMQTNAWAAIEAEIKGESQPGEEDELAKQIFGDDGLPVGKKWLSKVEERLEKRILQRMAPIAREVNESKEHQVIGRALKSAGLPANAIDTEAFETFRSDFEQKNKGFVDFLRKNPGTAANWLAKEYAVKSAKAGRPSMGGAETSLERGGGVSVGVGSAASKVTINRRDPQKYEKILKAYDNGHAPVDENGNSYRRNQS